METDHNWVFGVPGHGSLGFKHNWTGFGYHKWVFGQFLAIEKALREVCLLRRVQFMELSYNENDQFGLRPHPGQGQGTCICGCKASRREYSDLRLASQHRSSRRLLPKATNICVETACGASTFLWRSLWDARRPRVAAEFVVYPACFRSLNAPVKLTYICSIHTHT